tara:strand:- start:94 stop:465 length:372 start_codon:yes stop_codon:yes gene_type:complete
MPIKTQSRYDLANLNSFIANSGGHLSNETVQIGTDIHTTPDKDYLCESSGEQRMLVTEYITFRFGYWLQVPVTYLANALGCSPEAIIEDIIEDDDCSDRYHYKVPTTSHYHYINFQPSLISKL